MQWFESRTGTNLQRIARIGHGSFDILLDRGTRNAYFTTTERAADDESERNCQLNVNVNVFNFDYIVLREKKGKEKQRETRLYDTISTWIGPIRMSQPSGRGTDRTHRKDRNMAVTYSNNYSASGNQTLPSFREVRETSSKGILLLIRLRLANKF